MNEEIIRQTGPTIAIIEKLESFLKYSLIYFLNIHCIKNGLYTA